MVGGHIKGPVKDIGTYIVGENPTEVDKMGVTYLNKVVDT